VPFPSSAIPRRDALPARTPESPAPRGTPPGLVKPASFIVWVRDTSKPRLRLPASLTAAAVNADGAPVEFAATAVDAVDGSVVECDHDGGNFALGKTHSCSATDKAGNRATDSFVVVSIGTALRSIFRRS
jgi:hypothetical protein